MLSFITGELIYFYAKILTFDLHRLPVRKSNKLFMWFKNFEFQAKKIDVFSRVFFPFVFAVFNIWYWSFYLSRSGEWREKHCTCSWFDRELIDVIKLTVVVAKCCNWKSTKGSEWLGGMIFLYIIGNTLANMFEFWLKIDCRLIIE